MGGFLSKDVMNKIDQYVDIPAECEDIDQTINAEINQSIGIITDKLKQRYAPTVSELRADVGNYVTILRWAGIIYIILFLFMFLIQLLIVILLIRNKNLY